jgi:hypothetical protein
MANVVQANESLTGTGVDDRTMAQQLQAGLPLHIFAVAARNAKKRFFIPSKSNTFAGITYHYVMVDNGCNGIILPFSEQVLQLFAAPLCKWKIVGSQGSGAVKSPMLVINRLDGANLGSMCLASSGPLLALTRLRFQLGTDSAQFLSSHNKLSDTCKVALSSYLARMGDCVAPERKHVLLGQVYLRTVLSVQLGDVYMMGDPDMFPTVQDYTAVCALLESVRDDFPEFDDLEDEDHGGDADEEALDSDIPDIDEPNDEYMDDFVDYLLLLPFGELMCVLHK